MTYSGFCIKQNKDYSVSFKMIDSSALEDSKSKFKHGRLECEYAGFTGCCNSPEQCSILQNLKE